MGETFRQSGEEGGVKEAKRYFTRAVSMDRPSAYRGLGLLLYKEGNKAAAAKAFRSYISLAPNARDRTYIEDYLAQCR